VPDSERVGTLLLAGRLWAALVPGGGREEKSRSGYPRVPDVDQADLVVPERGGGCLQKGAGDRGVLNAGTKLPMVPDHQDDDILWHGGGRRKSSGSAMFPLEAERAPVPRARRVTPYEP